MPGHFSDDGRLARGGGFFAAHPKLRVVLIVVAALFVIGILASIFGGGSGDDSDKEQQPVQQEARQQKDAGQDESEPQPVDKTYLRGSVEAAWAIDQTLYTPESYAAMRAMIDEGGTAATVLNDPNSTQQQVNDANTRLNEAMRNLKEVLNPANYATVAYSDVARTPDAYVGQKLAFSGKVLQVVETSDETDLRIATDGGWDNVIMAGFDPSIIDFRILEDDYVTVYGTCLGLYTYTATLGQQISVPAVYCDYVVMQ